MQSKFSNLSRRIRWQADSKSKAHTQEWLQAIDWQKGHELLPAIVQDALTKQVLMQGFMNRASLEQSLETGKVTFYSRSRKTLWCKGETSGNYLHIKELALDCDCDSLLISAEPCGPTCHLGCNSCYSQPIPSATSQSPTGELAKLGRDFARSQKNENESDADFAAESLGIGWLGALQRIIRQRSSQKQAQPESKPSYVQSLLAQGTARIAQKVGEEGLEVALASMSLKYSKPTETDKLRTELAGEAGDLLFHLLVLLQNCDMELQDAIDVLERRHRKSLEALEASKTLNDKKNPKE